MDHLRAGAENGLNSNNIANKAAVDTNPVPRSSVKVSRRPGSAVDQQIIAQVGNYGELYEANIARELPVALPACGQKV